MAIAAFPPIRHHDGRPDAGINHVTPFVFPTDIAFFVHLAGFFHQGNALGFYRIQNHRISERNIAFDGTRRERQSQLILARQLLNRQRVALKAHVIAGGESIVAQSELIRRSARKSRLAIAARRDFAQSEGFARVGA